MLKFFGGYKTGYRIYKTGGQKQVRQELFSFKVQYITNNKKGGSFNIKANYAGMPCPDVQPPPEE